MATKQQKKTNKTTRELTTTEDNKQVSNANLPDYMKKAGGRGSEEVTTQDMIIPRIDVIQALSPERKRNDAKFIPGAEEGMLFNTITRELYGPEIRVVPVVFKREFLIWKDRDSGGGFRGAFETMEEAKESAADAEAKGDSVTIVETAQQIVLVIGKKGQYEEAVISMSRSKLKVSRAWNSMIRMAGADRFSFVYILAAVEENGAKGEYWNFQIKPTKEYTPKDAYAYAEKLYESISGGERKVRVNNAEGNRAESSEY